MEIIKHTFCLDELELKTRAIEALMGYDTEAPGEMTALINAELHYLQDAAGIEGGYQVLDASLNCEEQVVQVQNQLFHVGKSVCHHFQHSEKMALFVCTAGATISMRAKELMARGDVMEGYVVDVIGSMVVEQAMDKINEQLKVTMDSQGLSCTNRYSPGYCEWNVAEQSKLFSFFPDNFCGISLTESCLMLPVKSLSGFVGIGRNVQFHHYVCTACGSVNCIYRGKNKQN